MEFKITFLAFFSLKGLSINIEDVVLAYHYYRFSKDDESLSNLVKIIGYYSKNALELDDFDPTITDYSVDATLTFEQSIALMKKFLAFVDKSLLDYATQRKLYSERFHFSDTDKAILGFSARMDRDATYSFSKISARGFRIESLKRYLMSFHNPDPWYEFHLDVLLNKLYDVYYQTVEDDKIISSPGPTISSLAEIAEQECQQWEKNSEHYRIYDDIGKFIQYPSIRTLAIVTNQGKVWYLTKKESFDDLRASIEKLISTFHRGSTRL